MSWFGEPELEYSADGGKTWRNDGPCIGPGTIMRVFYAGKVIMSFHSVQEEITCETCGGTGKAPRYRYVRDS